MKRDKKKARKKNDFFFVCKHIRFSWGLIVLALVIGSVVVKLFCNMCG